ncbi:MAG: hypothetical protein ACAI43_22925 [Phycisphaerae bacterium]
MYDITGGGNFSGATAKATGLGTNLGQIAWSSDRQIAYTTVWTSGPVKAVTNEGVVTDYANVTNGLGIIVTQTGRVLVASRNTTSTILDITNPTSITTFATVPGTVRNMQQLPSGEILVAGASSGNDAKIWNVASGTAVVWADLPGGEGADIDYTSSGRVFASVWNSSTAAQDAVYEVTGGGNFSAAAPFAKNTSGAPNFFFGLAIDRATDQILSAPPSQNYVLDITAGGNFSSASTRWASNIPTTHDMALDFVPLPVPEPAALGFVATAATATILGRRRRSHRD